MLGLIVAIAIGQYPESKGDLARHDLAFARAVEESVMAAAPGWKPPYSSLMAMMGDPSWKTREWATRSLEESIRAGGSMRWLFWGRKSPDPEIASRANSILRRLHACPSCHGTGTSGGTFNYECWDCAGFGGFWPFSWLD